MCNPSTFNLCSLSLLDLILRGLWSSILLHWFSQFWSLRRGGIWWETDSCQQSVKWLYKILSFPLKKDSWKYWQDASECVGSIRWSTIGKDEYFLTQHEFQSVYFGHFFKVFLFSLTLFCCWCTPQYRTILQILLLQ